MLHINNQFKYWYIYLKSNAARISTEYSICQKGTIALNVFYTGAVYSSVSTCCVQVLAPISWVKVNTRRIRINRVRLISLAHTLTLRSIFPSGRERTDWDEDRLSQDSAGSGSEVLLGGLDHGGANIQTGCSSAAVRTAQLPGRSWYLRLSACSFFYC